MERRIIMRYLMGTLFAVLLLAGCTAEPETIRETVVITRVVEVEGETVVEERVITATPPPVEETEAEEAEEAEEPMADSDTILIGGFGPLSAPGSYQGGTEMRQAAELAVDEVNDAGGVLGKDVELIFGDTEGLPERGTAVTERLITQNNVVGLVGEYHSGVALAEMEVAHRYGIPVVFAEPWSDDVTGSGYDEIFRIAPSIDLYSSIATDYIEAVGWEQIVFVVEDTDYGREQGGTWQAQLEEKGITDVEVIYADPATEDFTPILQRIAQDPPDLLGGVITGIGNSRMLNQACDLGLAPTAETAYYASIDAVYPEFWENVGDCGQYAFFTYVGLPRSLWNDKTEAFMATFEERYGTTPGAPALESYDATHILLAAIEEAGSTEPEAIIAALEQIEYEGALGDIWFEYGNHNPLPDDQPAWMWHQWPTPTVMILQYTEVGQSADEAAVVFPMERATGDLYTAPPQ
ncbi:MAG TPA: ABC transporter substrate-binding protein [Candidatus Sulfomarinibacteraceae bacterium]|nr:ABC transporter substrate-binding protein [Candidatus Sulfomarinibacteraceae bacterium]